MVEEVTERNFHEYERLFKKMFPNDENPEQECRRLFKEKREFPFLYTRDGEVLGYISLSIRNDYVNGTSVSPVVFVEAVYVEAMARRAGIGRELFNCARTFAKEKGIKEVASDCQTTNTASEQFHKACGFFEAERVICFTCHADSRL